MPKFRKKPIIVDAWHWQGRTLSEARAFCKANGLPRFSSGARNSKVGLIIRTLEGDMVAQCGDWIIKGVNGKFYPCKPDIFKQTYERVND